ncbi:hypothetical protein DHEL01_v207425 [Diaporthe helianthi]|uniref:DUF7605 domain-containing protein n=1 Tax=Diaporthe helianthi TaxID=158607 RepID=A0A2P5HVD7_DIAHE|nr:hypothetical protein DHEL01_v207425 [Diaporthe helianthi]
MNCGVCLPFHPPTESEWPESDELGDVIGQALDYRKDLLLDRMEDIFDRFGDVVSLVRIDTLTWLNGSMIRRIMSRVCQEAMQHRGKGCTRLRQAVVNRNFTNEGVFHDITKELRQGFKGHVEHTQQELDELVSTQLDATRATFDIAREENSVQENEREPDFRQRVADEVIRARSLIGM